MTKTGNFLFFLSFLFCGFFAHAAGTTVQSSVDRNEMGVGDTFTLTVSVVSSDDVNIQDPRIPDLDGFDLLNSWQSTAVAQKLVNTSQGMQFETQRRKEFHYMFNAKRAGTLSMSSFEVVVNGKVFRTQPIVIKVGGQGSGALPKRPSQMPGMPGSDDPFEAMDQAEEEIFNQLLRQRQRLLQQQMGQVPDENYPSGAAGLPEAAFRSLPTNPNEAFFISVEVDKTEVYEGEQVTVNWYIYTRGQMETLDRLKFPSLKGFWKEIIEEVPSIQFSEEVVNGIPWKKALLASHALFPIKPGTAVIDEYKIKSRVRLQAQGMGGFYGRPYEYTKSSSRVDIKVKPLPVEGRPSDFTGAVGQFDIHASVENQTVPVNQPVSLKVRFEGAGNAKLIDLPVLNLPVGLEQYDTKSESKFFKNGRSYKEFEVLVIPRQEGDITIPALSVSMFDPQAKKYYTKSTQPISLKIVNNPNAPVGSSSRMADNGKAAAKPVVVENKLPDPIMAWEPATEASVLYRPWLWAVIYGGISLGLLVKTQREFGWGRRRRTLKELAQKRYKRVDAALSKSDYRKVGVEMTNIFYMVLGEVAGEGGASQEIERLLALMPPSLRRDYGDEIAKTFEIFQTMSFAPEEMLGSLKETSTMKTNVERGKKVVGAVISAVETK
ncbi:BatD family protein [Bdellovibrio sp. HCB-110]|uniref:BatD family protein n=1 Tax=Bdellovibrio sp. HCB-110 TaxID=3391182 RepID=UPI0039B37A6C